MKATKKLKTEIIQTKKLPREFQIKARSISMYFPQEYQPSSLDCLVEFERKVLQITILTTRQARLFNHIKIKKAKQKSDENENHVYVMSNKSTLDVLAMVEAVRKTVKEKWNLDASLNDFEIIEPPSKKEIEDALMQWKRLINSAILNC